MQNTWKNTSVCLVKGKYQTNKETGEEYETITLGAIFDLANQPPHVGNNDYAPSVIFSTYHEYDARYSEPQKAKGSYVALWADIDEGGHPMSEVISAVERVAESDHAWLIYSTSSATEESPRWRVIVPLAEALPFERWEIAQKAFATQLASQGITIDLCAERGNQVAKLPMARSFYQTKANAEAEALDVDGDWLFLAAYHQAEEVKAQEEQALKVAAEAARKRREERQAKAQRDGSESPIEWFNKQNQVSDMLAECGYIHRGGNSPNWRSPYQTSGSYATRDFGDYWVSLSGSDAAAGIGATCAGGRYGDAFDLYVHFQHGGDFNAAVRTVGAEMPKCFVEDFDNLTEHNGDEVKPSDKSGFHFTPVWQLEYRPPEFLVQDLIETESLGLIFGDPGCGKSFVAVDLAMSVATGLPFHGREVKQGSVFFIAGEGHNGLTRRMAAWAKYRSVDKMEGIPLFKSNRAAQLLDATSASEVKRAVAALASEHGDPALIVIDTLARNFGAGDENSTKDMSEFVAAVDDLRVQFPTCTVLIVHHTGHAEKQRARGAMALKGALDCEYRLEKQASTIKMTNTKMKDAEPPSDMAFLLRSIDLGENASSAVLAHTDAPVKAKALTGNEKLAVDSFIDAARETKQFVDDGSVGLHLEEWRKAFYARHTGDTVEAKKKAFQNVRKSLVAKGKLAVEDDIYTMIDPVAALLIRRPPADLPEEYAILGFDPDKRLADCPF